MKQITGKNESIFFAILALFIILIPNTVLSSEPKDISVSTESGLVLVEGKVRRFNSDEQTLQLQIKNGEKITIKIDWSTELVGYSSPAKIEKGNKVKIWYQPNSTSTTAVKIEKKLMLGC